MQATSTPAIHPGSRSNPIQAIAAPALPGLLNRLLRRPKPTLYHRCLAMHIAAAGSRSALR